MTTSPGSACRPDRRCPRCAGRDAADAALDLLLPAVWVPPSALAPEERPVWMQRAEQRSAAGSATEGG